MVEISVGIKAGSSRAPVDLKLPTGESTREYPESTPRVPREYPRCAVDLELPTGGPASSAEIRRDPPRSAEIAPRAPDGWIRRGRLSPGRLESTRGEREEREYPSREAAASRRLPARRARPGRRCAAAGVGRLDGAAGRDAGGACRDRLPVAERHDRLERRGDHRAVAQGEGAREDPRGPEIAMITSSRCRTRRDIAETPPTHPSATAPPLQSRLLHPLRPSDSPSCIPSRARPSPPARCCPLPAASASRAPGGTRSRDDPR